VLLSRYGILPGAKFTLRSSLALSCIGSVTARHSSSGHQPDCCVEQRAPPIFGRAAITLGIGPRSSCLLITHNYVCESAFSIMKHIKSKTRSRLDSSGMLSELSECTRLALSVIPVDISSLTAEAKFHQCSHYACGERTRDLICVIRACYCSCSCSLLVLGQVTIIFVVPVCLFVCAEFLSAVFGPISIKLGHILYVWV